MSDAKRQDEVSASIPPQEAEEGADADRQDPFRFGWHSIDVELVKEFASKPLPRTPDEDLVKTAPPGFGPADSIPVRSLTPAAPSPAEAVARATNASKAEIPALSRASYWPGLVLLLCATGGVAYWAIQATDMAAPHRAAAIETSTPSTLSTPSPGSTPSIPSIENREVPEPDDEPQREEPPSAEAPADSPPKEAPPTARPTAPPSSAGKAPGNSAAPPAPAKIASPANVPADKAPADAVSPEKPPAASGTSPGSRPKIWFDLE